MGPYLLSISLVVVGLLVLVAVLRSGLRKVRRFSKGAAMVNNDITDRAGMLRARSAALGVAIRQRRRLRIESGPARVQSGRRP